MARYLLNFIIINSIIMILNVQKWLGSSLPVNCEHILPGFPQKEPHFGRKMIFRRCKRHFYER